MLAIRVLLITIPLALSGCDFYWYLTQCHTALDWPMVLNEGQYESPEFETKFGKFRYYAYVKALRQIPNERLYCYMGVDAMSGRCIDAPPQLDFTWQLLTDNRVVASGKLSSRCQCGSYGKDDVERSFGGFETQEGRKYRLRITVLSSGALLMTAKPHIEIRTCYNPMHEGMHYVPPRPIGGGY